MFDGFSAQLAQKNEDTVFVEGSEYSTIVAQKTDHSQLMGITLLSYDNGRPLTLKLDPERNITPYETMLITQLLVTEGSKPGNIWILKFVQHHNLERHFKITPGRGPFP